MGYHSMNYYQQTIGGKLYAVATEALDSMIVYGGPDHRSPGSIIEQCGRGDGRAMQIRAEFDKADERGMAFLRSIKAHKLPL